MKAAVRLVPVVMVVVLAGTAFGQIIPGDPDSYPSVSVKNTPHNLNTYPGVTIEGNQICLPCHTPHNALKFGYENILWNHAETDQFFTMYFEGDPNHAPVDQPTGRSKMCLSCHDGVTAIDNYGGNGGTGIVITGSAALNPDLSNDHPIGVIYPTGNAEYQDPSSFLLDANLGIGGGAGVKLVEVNLEDRVECTSCHNPHNNGLGKFLRVPIQESWLCLQCHIK